MTKYSSIWHCTLSIGTRQGGREENQDSYAYSDTPLGFLAVVCDGMGGGPAGANASMLAVQAIVDSVKQAPAGLPLEEVLTLAVQAANALLRQSQREHFELRGMGTTCVAVLVAPRVAVVAHVGDSRFYQLRDGKQIFRTADHSVVGEMVRKGELTEDDARRAKKSNVITRSLGLSDTVEVEIDKISLLPADRLVLCTDGLWGMMPEEELVRLLGAAADTDELVPLVMDNVDTLGREVPGADYDNLTLAILQIEGQRVAAVPGCAAAVPGGAGERPAAVLRRKSVVLPLLLAGSLLLSAVLAFFLFLSPSSDKPDADQSQINELLDENAALRRENELLKNARKVNEGIGRQKSQRPAAEPVEKKGKQGEVTSKKKGKKEQKKGKTKNGGKVTINEYLMPNAHYESASEEKGRLEKNRMETIDKFMKWTKSRKKEPSSVELCSGKETGRRWISGKQALRKKSPGSKNPDRRELRPELREKQGYLSFLN